MNDRTLESLWHSPANQLPSGQLDAYKAGLIASVQSKRRALTIAIGTLVAVLALMLGSFLGFVRDGGAFSVTYEWGALVFLGLPLVVLAAIIRRHFRHLESNSHYYESVTRCLEALLDEVRFSQQRVIWSSIALTCAMGLLPTVTAQLQAVGKQTSQESLSMMLVFGACYVVIVVALMFYYRKRLMPRRRALESVLQGRAEDQEAS